MIKDFIDCNHISKSRSYSIISSHLCRHPYVPLLMCLERALEKSVQVTAVISEYAEMDNYLEMWCKRREPVPSDGHCILHSWIKVNATTFSVDTILVFFTGFLQFNRLTWNNVYPYVLQWWGLQFSVVRFLCSSLRSYLGSGYKMHTRFKMQTRTTFCHDISSSTKICTRDSIQSYKQDVLLFFTPF